MTDINMSEAAKVREALQESTLNTIIGNINPVAKTVPGLYETIVKRISTSNAKYRYYFAHTKLWGQFRDWLNLTGEENLDAKPPLSLFLATKAAHLTLTHKKWDRFELSTCNRGLDRWAEEEIARLAHEAAESDVRQSVEGSFLFGDKDNADDTPSTKLSSVPPIKREPCPTTPGNTTLPGLKPETSSFFKTPTTTHTPSITPPKRKLSEFYYQTPVAPTASSPPKDKTKDQHFLRHRAKKSKIDIPDKTNSCRTTGAQTGDELIEQLMEHRVEQQLEKRVQKRLDELQMSRMQVNQCCQTDVVQKSPKPIAPASAPPALAAPPGIQATASRPGVIKTDTLPEGNLPVNLEARIDSAVSAAISRQTEILQRSLPEAVRSVLGAPEMLGRPDEMAMMPQYRPARMPPPRGMYRRPSQQGLPPLEGDPAWEYYYR